MADTETFAEVSRLQSDGKTFGNLLKEFGKLKKKKQKEFIASVLFLVVLLGVVVYLIF